MWEVKIHFDIYASWAQHALLIPHSPQGNKDIQLTVLAKRDRDCVSAVLSVIRADRESATSVEFELRLVSSHIIDTKVLYTNYGCMGSDGLWMLRKVRDMRFN